MVFFDVLSHPKLSVMVHQDYRKRIETARPQKFLGAISQMAAGLTHNVAPARLSSIAKSVPKVLILTGDKDHLVNPSNSHYLKQHMPEAELVEWEGTGHAIHLQRKTRFNALLERVFKEGKENLQHLHDVAGATPVN